MNEPKFRGFSKENNEWYYGYGWFKCDYTEEYKQEKGIEDRAILMTAHGPVECELSSMGRYALTVNFAETSEDFYEGDIIADITDSDLRQKYKILWDDYGYFLFIPLFKTEDSNPLYYHEVEYKHGDNMIVIGNEYQNPEIVEVALAELNKEETLHETN